MMVCNCILDRTSVRSVRLIWRRWCWDRIGLSMLMRLYTLRSESVSYGLVSQGSVAVRRECRFHASLERQNKVQEKFELTTGDLLPLPAHFCGGSLLVGVVVLAMVVVVLVVIGVLAVEAAEVVLAY